ncbi:hypothetical protein [Scytonema millei]|nr:hypothetical protein [Scytonema millei]
MVPLRANNSTKITPTVLHTGRTLSFVFGAILAPLLGLYERDYDR